jgi:hypothetical protein
MQRLFFFKAQEMLIFMLHAFFQTNFALLYDAQNTDYPFS